MKWIELRRCRNHARSGRHALANQVLDLRPEAGVALALHVAGGEGVLEPGGSGAGDGGFLVVEAVVAEDLGFGIIGGGDFGAAVDQAVGLVKICRGGDVVGDDFVVLPGLGDAVDLNRQEHGDSDAIEFAREHDHGGRSQLWPNRMMRAWDFSWGLRTPS